MARYIGKSIYDSMLPLLRNGASYSQVVQASGEKILNFEKYKYQFVVNLGFDNNRNRIILHNETNELQTELRKWENSPKGEQLKSEINQINERNKAQDIVFETEKALQSIKSSPTSPSASIIQNLEQTIKTNKLVAKQQDIFQTQPLKLLSSPIKTLSLDEAKKVTNSLMGLSPGAKARPLEISLSGNVISSGVGNQTYKDVLSSNPTPDFSQQAQEYAQNLFPNTNTSPLNRLFNGFGTTNKTLLIIAGLGLAFFGGALTTR